MKVLHFAENSTAVEVVELVAYNASFNNRCSVIKTSEGKILTTGGHIIPYTEDVKEILETVPTDKLFMFLFNVKRKAYGTDIPEYYTPENEYKKGDVIVANESHGNMITEGKRYVATKDTRTGPYGNLVCIVADNGGVHEVLARFFKKEIYYRDEH